jgi:hypothetical protein
MLPSSNTTKWIGALLATLIVGVYLYVRCVNNKNTVFEISVFATVPPKARLLRIMATI